MAVISQRKKNVLSYIYKQFINTLNFTGFLFIKRVTKHISLI